MRQFAMRISATFLKKIAMIVTGFWYAFCESRWFTRGLDWTLQGLLAQPPFQRLRVACTVLPWGAVNIMIPYSRQIQ